MDAQKEKFLRNEFLTMSLLGALGRSRTYSQYATEMDKNRFRSVFREKLDEVSKKYESVLTEEEHLSNIKYLSDDLTSRFHHSLKNGRFRIGIAQKALNLYLKYLWCVNLIKQPPHCPFDSIVISYLHNCNDLNWTSIDTIEDYIRLVRSGRTIARDKSLPAWELELWLTSIKSGMEKDDKKSGTERGYPECHNNLSERGAGYMPKKGDVFRGEIQDLSRSDTKGWRRRDIWFFKREVNCGKRFGYPTKRDRITLLDTEGSRYNLNFSKPDSEEKVCLGTPSRLKPWYKKKGFDSQAVNPNDRVYFEYTGTGIEFYILSDQEYSSKLKR